jgi:hypothetical protein
MSAQINPFDRKTISNTISKTFLRPALTSHFEVYVKAPTHATKPRGFFEDNQVTSGSTQTQDLILWCSDATLPGSSLMTHESNNDFTGVTERFAYRRLYDDRIDLSYYVDAVNHTTIRFFETWIKYVANEQIAEDDGKPKIERSNYFYRFRYPDGDKGYRHDSSLIVTKFERDYAQSGRGKKLVYEFVKPYPISFQSIPISYDGSQLLKCTVSMTYTRYFINPNKSAIGTTIEPTEPGQATSNQTPKSPFDITTQDLARLNSQAFNPNVNLGNLSAGTLTNTNFNSNNLF